MQCKMQARVQLSVSQSNITKCGYESKYWSTWEYQLEKSPIPSTFDNYTIESAWDNRTLNTVAGVLPERVKV